MAEKRVYFFGSGKAEGNAKMKELLGGKGANLAEMTNLGIPVPPGFTITTEVCTYFMKTGGKYPKMLEAEVKTALNKVEKIMGKRFGDPQDPLLFSVRSGARASMPGMMESILNIGLTKATIEGLIAKTGNERFVYDAYRRLIVMYSDVVMEKACGIEPKDAESGIRKQLEKIMAEMKKKDRGVERQMLSKALKVEVETRDFYKRMVAEMDGSARDMFARFLEIEDGHIAMVQAELDYISHTGYWLDFKEYDMEEL